MENSTPKNESEVFWYHVKVWGIRNVAILPGSEFRCYISKLIILFKGGESTAHSMLLCYYMSLFVFIVGGYETR